MKKNWISATIGFAVISLAAILLFSTPTSAQRGAQPAPSNNQKAGDQPLLDGWGRPVTDPLHGQKPGPAPKHDVSGIWEPARGPGDGIMSWGPRDMPYDGKPEHDPPYTPLGLQTLKTHKPVEGFMRVVTGQTNDPRNKCDPMGFPRQDFYQVRHTQIMQNDHQVMIMYQFYKVWRAIWTDGRELPKEIPEPRYFGYSVGKWTDDTTLEVTTIGMKGDPYVWLDSGGRPASDTLRVVEQFHRMDHDNLMLTVTIDDPKMYTKPWVAMKFPMKLQSPDYDVMEMMCIPSEMDQYNQDYGDVASGTEKK